MLSDLERKLRGWLQKRHESRLSRRFGGIQKCPWCRQWAQEGADWKIKAAEDGNELLICGICRGTSLWRFEMGMIYIGPVAAPKAHNPLFLKAKGSIGGRAEPDPAI